MALSTSTTLQSLYKSHEISPAQLKTRQDIVDYFSQERRNVVFVLRRTSARSRDDVLHKRLRHFLRCVSVTDSDSDLLESQAVLPTTLYTIFSYVDNHKESTGRFSPEEKHCAKLLYADFLLHGWRGRTNAFTWDEDEWYPFSQVNGSKPHRSFDIAREAFSVTQQALRSKVAARHARGFGNPKAVTFDNVTRVVEHDHLSQDVIQKSSSLDTGRDRTVRRLTRYPSRSKRVQRSQSPTTNVSSPPFADVSSTTRVNASGFQTSDPLRRQGHMRGRHSHPQIHLATSPEASTISPASEREEEKSAQQGSPSSAGPLRSPPPANVHIRGLSPLRQVSTTSPIVASPEEIKKTQEASLVESINKLRREVESLDIRELPVLEHMLLIKRTSKTEQGEGASLRKGQNAKRHGRRSLQALGPVRLRVCSIEEKACSMPGTPLFAPLAK